MQPTYIPWLGYFDLLDAVDKFIFLDDVQLEKRSWQIRNRIKTSHGELYLTVPIRMTKSRNQLMINEAIIDDEISWRKKHLKSIFLNYKKSTCFDEIFPFLERLIRNEISKLCDLNANIILAISNKIGINTKFMFSSNLKHVLNKKTLRLISICKEVGCNEYLSPQGAAAYIEINLPGRKFSENKIDLFYQNYEHPIYDQLYFKFLPFMSILDLLFNRGFAEALKIIRSGRRQSIDSLSFRRNYLKLEE